MIWDYLTPVGENFHHPGYVCRVCPCLGERLGLCLTAVIQAPLDRREHPNALRRRHAIRLGTLNHQFLSLHLVYCLTSIAFCNSCFLFTSHNECHAWLRHHNFFVLIASHRPLHLFSYPTTVKQCNCDLHVKWRRLWVVPRFETRFE